MSDPDQITVTLSREEAEALRGAVIFALAEPTFAPRLQPNLYLHRDADEKLRAAIENPQPSDTGRYEEALRERLAREFEKLADTEPAKWTDFQRGRVWAQKEAAKLVRNPDAALQPTGEKHG